MKASDACLSNLFLQCNTRVYIIFSHGQIADVVSAAGSLGSVLHSLYFIYCLASLAFGRKQMRITKERRRNILGRKNPSKITQRWYVFYVICFCILRHSYEVVCIGQSEWKISLIKALHPRDNVPIRFAPPPHVQYAYQICVCGSTPCTYTFNISRMIDHIIDSHWYNQSGVFL